MSWRTRIARWLVGKTGTRGVRMYGAARNTRTTAGFGNATTSADTELSTSLVALRNRSRQMVRDSAYARRARDLVVNNVVGTGVGMQAQVKGERGELRKPLNDSIESAWAEWCEAGSCHTGGAMHFSDLERAAMAQVFDTGECFVRVHFMRMGRSQVPLALELIEPERLADQLAEPGGVVEGAEVRMGVEVEQRFKRPLAYWIARGHPGDIRHPSGIDRAERVPASEVFHLRVVHRWPQTRGEPWMHSVVRKLDDMNEYSQLELTAARGSAAYFATIETAEPDNPLVDRQEDDGSQVMDLQPLTIQELNPGEQLKFHAPNRPNTAMDPFLRYMLREVAAGIGCSYESLSRDYSQSNYSSSRLALLDDRDVWRVLQQWWIRSFRMPLHRLWMQQAVASGAVAIPRLEFFAQPGKFEAVRFKPRGWSWIDPTKEVEAYKQAILAGMTTLSDVIASTGEGRDLEDVINTRVDELERLAAAGIEVDTVVQPPAPPAAAPATDPAPPDGARVLPMRKGQA